MTRGRNQIGCYVTRNVGREDETRKRDHFGCFVKRKAGGTIEKDSTVCDDVDVGKKEETMELKIGGIKERLFPNLSIWRLRNTNSCLPKVIHPQKKIKIIDNSIEEEKGGKKNNNKSSTSTPNNSIDKLEKQSNVVNLNVMMTLNSMPVTTRSKSHPVKDVLNQEHTPTKECQEDDDGNNIIINYRDLIEMMSLSMCCQKCKSTMDKSSFHRTLCGFATSFL